MQVVITKHVKGVGKPGDVTEVPNGYAQNYLIPNGLAVRATGAALQAAVSQAARQRKIAAATAKQAQKLSKQLVDFELQLQRPASENGTLFAAVHRDDIITALRSQQIDMPADTLPADLALKQVGQQPVAYRLANGTTGQLTITITAADH